jgi:5-methylcytosine-specific restriction endonuclease McrA
MPPAERPVVKPLSPARYKVQFTASAELHEKLNRLQALMRSSVPDGDLAAIIEEAVTEKLERLEAKRFARSKAPRKTLEQTSTIPSSRYIPAPVRRAVRERDGNQCTFVGSSGNRCTKRDNLEFHHRDPFGRGGDHSPENLQLVCRIHNAYFAERDYGEELMKRYRRSADRVSEPLAPYATVRKRPLFSAACRPVSVIVPRRAIGLA